MRSDLTQLVGAPRRATMIVEGENGDVYAFEIDPGDRENVLTVFIEIAEHPHGPAVFGGQDAKLLGTPLRADIAASSTWRGTSKSDLPFFTIKTLPAWPDLEPDPGLRRVGF